MYKSNIIIRQNRKAFILWSHHHEWISNIWEFAWKLLYIKNVIQFTNVHRCSFVGFLFFDFSPIRRQWFRSTDLYVLFVNCFSAVVHVQQQPKNNWQTNGCGARKKKKKNQFYNCYTIIITNFFWFNKAVVVQQ